MQNRAPPSATTSDSKSPSLKRKKLTGPQPSSNPDNTTTTTTTTKQQTISELFSASQQKPLTRDASGHALSPTCKRPKLDHHPSDPPPTTSPLSASPLPPEKMYNFPSTQPRNNNVIDLTKSPGSSPSPRRTSGVNGARPSKPGFNPHMGAKKLVVKNLRTATRTDPKQYFEQIWSQLDAALMSIFRNEKVTYSNEELYRGVENLCRQGHASDLCSRLQEKTKAFIVQELKKPLLEKAAEKNVDVLRAVLEAWKTWNTQLITVRSIFLYMDRSYLLQSSRPSLWEMAVALFRSVIFDEPQLKSKIVDGACELVALDRAGEDLDQATLRNAVSMFHDLSTYTSVFEPRLLELSQTYIMTWADQASVEKGLAEYVKESVKLMDREMERCNLFNLDKTTRRDLLTLLETHLIQRKEERLVNQDDIADLLEENAVEDLERLYTLLERRRLCGKLRPPFEKWIDDTGTAIVFDQKEQDQMVVKLLTLKKQLDNIWRVSFHRDTDLGHALREAFETFINKSRKSSATWNTDNSKPGEMIAKYVDMLLRGGAKAIPAALSHTKKPALSIADEEDMEDVGIDEDAEVNNQLDQVLDLFRFVHGKAVFEAFYKKDLARRLLMGRSASADAERSMLTRLKTECGAGFTQNLEQMFKDVELSREEMASYKMILSERHESPPIDLSVNILSASAWPTYPDIPVVVPQDVKTSIDRFEQHYKSKHSGRKLDWKHALAHCQIRARFPKGNKELVVSSFQAVVLLMFNSIGPDERISYEVLKAATGLPEPELKRALQSLACAKLRPLTKHPKGRDINPTDVFSLNLDFSDPRYRIKINQVQLKETKEENKETHERVAADRNFETQAAIVRIMKSRKTIGHSELIAEVINATKSRGVLGVADIKRNIDRLIDKDYMERDEGNTYSYIA